MKAQLFVPKSVVFAAVEHQTAMISSSVGYSILEKVTTGYYYFFITVFIYLFENGL